MASNEPPRKPPCKKMSSSYVSVKTTKKSVKTQGDTRTSEKERTDSTTQANFVVKKKPRAAIGAIHKGNRPTHSAATNRFRYKPNQGPKPLQAQPPANRRAPATFTQAKVPLQTKPVVPSQAKKSSTSMRNTKTQSSYCQSATNKAKTAHSQQVKKQHSSIVTKQNVPVNVIASTSQQKMYAQSRYSQSTTSKPKAGTSQLARRLPCPTTTKPKVPSPASTSITKPKVPSPASTSITNPKVPTPASATITKPKVPSPASATITKPKVPSPTRTSTPAQDQSSPCNSETPNQSPVKTSPKKESQSTKSPEVHPSTPAPGVEVELNLTEIDDLLRNEDDIHPHDIEFRIREVLDMKDSVITAREQDWETNGNAESYRLLTSVVDQLQEKVNKLVKIFDDDAARIAQMEADADKVEWIRFYKHDTRRDEQKMKSSILVDRWNCVKKRIRELRVWAEKFPDERIYIGFTRIYESKLKAISKRIYEDAGIAGIFAQNETAGAEGSDSPGVVPVAAHAPQRPRRSKTTLCKLVEDNE